MTIFGSHVGPCLPNIEYFEVYEGLQALGGIPSFFVVKFHIECNENHVWGPLVARDMSVFLISKYSLKRSDTPPQT